MSISQDQLNLILALHIKWLRDEEGGKRADLRGADLRGAYLTDAKYYNLILTKDDKFVQLNGLEYNIIFIQDHIKIGCKFYSKKQWVAFTDDEILKMDGKKGFDFWNKYKDMILSFKY